MPEWRPELTSSLQPLGRIARRRIERSSGSEPLGSISFGGDVKERGGGRASKGRLFVAHADDVVFSKIDIRNGAVGVVPSELQSLAFSSEYPAFSLDSESALRPAYMQILCRTEVFRAQVNAQVVGHSGRRRLSPEEFEKLLVPVPDLAVQDDLLNELARRREEADKLRAEGLPLIAAAGAQMLADLGVQVPTFEVLRRPFTVRRSEILRWSVRKGMAAKAGTVQELTCDTGFRQLGDPNLATVAYGVTKNPGNRPKDHARPYLRVANVQDAFLDLREMKYIDVPDASMKSYRLEEGDLLLCEGNSRELVGRPAIWSGEIQDCVHQNHVLRVRVNQNELVPEYVLAYMHGPAGRWYFDECAKQTTNLATINSTDLKNMPIPVPALARQEELARSVEEARTKAEALRSAAFDLDTATDEWLAQQVGSAGAEMSDDDGDEDGSADEAAS